LERGDYRYLKSLSIKRCLFCAIVVCLSNFTLAQEINEQQSDSVKTGVALGKILIENPDSIVSKYSYDAKIDRYVYTESDGDYNVNYPLFLKPEQYYELIRKERMKS